MRTETMAANPFELMMDPERVRQTIAKSESLGKLSQRQCHLGKFGNELANDGHQRKACVDMRRGDPQRARGLGPDCRVQ